MQLLGNEETENNKFKPCFSLVLAWPRKTMAMKGGKNGLNPKKLGLFRAVGHKLCNHNLLKFLNVKLRKFQHPSVHDQN